MNRAPRRSDLEIRIGPLEIVLQIQNPALAKFFAQHLQNFIQPVSAHAKRLLIHNDPHWPEPMASQWWLDGREDQVFSGNGGYPFVIAGDYTDVRADHIFNEQRFKGPFLALRYAVEHWLPELGGLSLHAASIAYHDNGLLVVGPSGAGKSTLASIAGAAFSDEWSLVYPKEGQWLLTASPFSRPFAGHRLSDDLPLQAIIKPLHAPPQKLSTLRVKDILPELLRQGHRLQRQAIDLQHWLKNAESLSLQVPGFALRFFPKTGALDPVIEAVQKPQLQQRSSKLMR